jgi:hypothetical protein
MARLRDGFDRVSFAQAHVTTGIEPLLGGRSIGAARTERRCRGGRAAIVSTGAGPALAQPARSGSADALPLVAGELSIRAAREFERVR